MAAGAVLEQVIVYTNRDVDHVPAAEIALLDSGAVDWIGVSSPSIARNLVSLLSPAARNHLGTRTKLCAISPVTAAAMQSCGLPVSAIAREHTWEGMFAAMIAGEGD